MEKKIFIHIGLPKCGSSFLQQKLLPYLASSGKVNFLNVQKMFDVTAKIAYQDPFAYSAQETRAQIEEKLKPGVNVITVEWFSGIIGYKSFNTLETARRLAETFPEAVIILFLRNQVDFAYSAYKQHIHQGGILTLDNYFNIHRGKIINDFCHKTFRFDDHRLYWNSLLYSNLFKAYSTFVNKGRFKVFLFENLILDAKAFVSRLLDEIGVDDDLEELDSRPANQGYGRNQISIARLLNRFVRSPYNQVGIRPIPVFDLQAVHIRRLLQSSISFRLLGRRSITRADIDSAIKNFFLTDNQKVVSMVSNEDRSVFEEYYIEKYR